EVFAELEFKTLGKRILGDEFNIFESTSARPVPAGVQQDLFGNVVAVEQKKPEIIIVEEEVEISIGLVTEKNIRNTPHNYVPVEGEEAIKNLVEQIVPLKEISFDTETTGI